MKNKSNHNKITKNKTMKKNTKQKSTQQRSLPNFKEIQNTYNMNDYNSNDGMLTSIWGPGMWHYLHTMSFNYPVNPTEKDKKHYKDFVLSLRHVLPCGKCRANLRNNFKILPLYKKHMKNRGTFSKYIFDLHELINTMLGKKSGLTYEVVRERYEHFRSRCVNSKTKKRRKTTESGCVDSLYGEKSKCILQIVPQDTKCNTLNIDNRCIKQRDNVVSVLKNNT